MYWSSEGPLERFRIRLIRIKAPEGKGEQVAQIAFSIGIVQVSFSQQHIRTSDQQREIKDVLEIETSTPAAKPFIDALMTASLERIDAGQRFVLNKPSSLMRPMLGYHQGA